MTNSCIHYYNVVNMIEKCNPESVIIVWEGGGSKRKRDLYPDYKKGKRPPKMNRYYDKEELPDSLENRNFQMSTLIGILSNLPVSWYFFIELITGSSTFLAANPYIFLTVSNLPPCENLAELSAS